MSKTFLITGMSAAMADAGLTAFDFDILDRLQNVHVLGLRHGVMRRLGFAADAYINIAIQRMVSDYRQQQESNDDAAPAWDTYQAFLAFVTGYAHSEELMRETGMKVDDTRDVVQKLFNFRSEVHVILSNEIGQSYETPLITEWMRNPRVRRDDATTQAKVKNMLTSLATDDDGVIDVELQRQLEASYAIKSSITKADQLKWDKQRGELAALMFEALKISDSARDVGYTDEHDPFGELPSEFQKKLLDGCVRYVPAVLTDLANDRKVPYEEHAAAVVEAKPLMRDIKLALEHPRLKALAG